MKIVLPLKWLLLRARIFKVGRSDSNVLVYIMQSVWKRFHCVIYPGLILSYNKPSYNVRECFWILYQMSLQAPHASSLNYCTKTFQTTFTNPDRGQSKNSELSFTKSDLPLQVHSSLNRQNNHGRIYSGNNPSVTTILDATRPKNELYALHNWRRGLIKELGEGGYNDEVNKIKNRGTTFHQVNVWTWAWYSEWRGQVKVWKSVNLLQESFFSTDASTENSFSFPLFCMRKPIEV